MPEWARTARATAVTPGAAGADGDGALGRALAASECVLVDAETVDPLAVARRAHRAAPEVQLVIVVGSEARRRALERALVFAPGVGELWLASPEEVVGGIPERAGGVTRQRRRFRRTRERIERERIESSPQRTERALVSDAYLANLLQVLPDPVFSLDVAGRILSANPAAARALPAASGGLVGTALAAALGTRDATVARLLAAAADGATSAPVRFARADGGDGQGELRVARVAGSDPALFAAVLHDRTAGHRVQRQLEEQAVEMEAQAEELHATVVELEMRTEEAERAREAQAESERQFRTLADAIPTLAWTARPDGYIDWYNARWYEYTGTTPAQLAGWGWQSVHDPRVLPDVMTRWSASIASGEPFAMTFPLRGADGRFRAFLTRVVPVKDADGRVLRWFGTNTDVEAEREARAAAEVAEARLRDVFEQAPVAVAVLSGPEHVYTIVSPLYARSPGAGRPLLGRTFREAFPELDGTGYAETMDRVYETGCRSPPRSARSIWTWATAGARRGSSTSAISRCATRPGRCTPSRAWRTTSPTRCARGARWRTRAWRPCARGRRRRRRTARRASSSPR